MVKVLLTAIALFLSTGISGLNGHPANELTHTESALLAITGFDAYLASSIQRGTNQNSENSDTWKAFGTTMTVFFSGLAAFFLIIRSQEIRRQHPKNIH